MTERMTMAESLAQKQRRALVVGGVGALLLLVGAFLDFEQFFQSYLTGWLLLLGLGLGSLAIVMLHNLTGGAWGFAIHRTLEAGMRTLPVVAVLFLPVLLGLGGIYAWADPEVVAHDELVAHKRAYLNVPFWLARAALYFTVWILLARRLLRLSQRFDRTGNPRTKLRQRLWSGPGLVVYVLTMTFASVDWAMSLEPHWFSTIYGVHFVVGQALSTLCLAILAAAWLARHEPFQRWLEPSHFHDLGNLLLAFTMLWAYVSFSQYLIIWSGNLPEETPWYLHRTTHGWQAIALVLVVLHFAVPFAVLLSRRTKRRVHVLAAVAAGVLAMRVVDLFWLIAPAFHHHGFHLSWMDVVAPVALGGLWIAAFVRMLRDRPLLSLQDARLTHQLEEAPAP